MGECPSRIRDTIWLYAIAPSTVSSDLAKDSVGKWLVFASPAKVDDLWAKIYDGIERDGLDQNSLAAKVSTAVSVQKGSHVICIYTPDFRDKLQAASCLLSLRRLGISGVLSYKTDSQTHAGLKASIYSSKDFENS